MPTVEGSVGQWSQAYDWVEAGDEWSMEWGGADVQCYGSLFPRIHAFVPAQSILEIASGCGRWTEYLKNICQHQFVVDLSDKCIQACKIAHDAFQPVWRSFGSSSKERSAALVASGKGAHE